MVITASKGVEIAKGKLGGQVEIDVEYSNQKAQDYDAVVFVGGGGALVYENDQYAVKLINDFFETKKIVAAICIAPRVLASSGILNGRRATVWNGDGYQEVLFGKIGVDYVGESVVVDGNIITANGPAAAKDFAETVLESMRIK